jgi:hypothetical protein
MSDMPPVLEVLRSVDPSFAEMPNIGDAFVTTAFRNQAKYRVDFLTPNRGASKLQGRPARMKALGGTGAQPLRHLDFLIHEPERSVLLVNGGVPVSVPRAERYAVHKLIVAAERQDQVKAVKDSGRLTAGLAQVLGQSAALGFMAVGEFAEGAAPFRSKPCNVVGSARLQGGMLFGGERGGCSGAQMRRGLADLGPAMREFQSDF